VVTLRLLVADDEPALLSLLRRFLEKAGYAVLSAPSGEAALALFSAEPDSFALIVTDLSMDGMGGEDLIRQIRQIRPSIPAILMSGYPHVPSTPDTGFLQKPFLPDMLTTAVREALSSSL
jgi:DNA-binding NtrC family response regulator